MAIHLAACLSGTYEPSLREAAKTRQTGMEVYILDSRQLSDSLGLVVLRAAQAAEAGMKASEIEARLLNLKPIVSVDETGKSTLYGKSFSGEPNLRTIAWSIQNLANFRGTSRMSSKRLYDRSVTTSVFFCGRVGKEQPVHHNGNDDG